MKPFITATLFFFIGIVGKCQYSSSKNFVSEFGLALNAMNCNTDIGGKVADLKNFRPSAGIYAELLYQNFLGVRLEATMGKVIATDANATKKIVRTRNLSFRSNINEISLLGELHPLMLKNRQTAYSPAVSLYLLAGLGYFSFNPQAMLDNKWIDLQPLHTEGQGFPEVDRPNYKLSQINMLMGGGIQYNLSERFTLRGEAIYRVLRTDYLDDVSTNYIRNALFDKYLSESDATLAKRLADRSAELDENLANHPGERRGNPKKDAYYTIGIKLGIKLANTGGGGGGYAKRIRKTTGCYRF